MSTVNMRVRLLVGDNDDSAPIFTNSQVATALEIGDNDVYAAAAILARNKAAEFSRRLPFR